MTKLIDFIKVKFKGERATPLPYPDINTPMRVRVITPDGSPYEEWYNGGYSHYLWNNRHSFINRR